jgi:hypothetical protein
MGALQTTVFFLFLLKACEINANIEEWKTATATYSKETDGSIITGTFLASKSQKFVNLLSFTTYSTLYDAAHLQYINFTSK